MGAGVDRGQSFSLEASWQWRWPNGVDMLTATELYTLKMVTMINFMLFKF